jgi:hypothetical protein
MSFVSFAHHNIQGVRRKAEPAHILIAWRLITVLSFVLKQTVCCSKNSTQIHKLKFVHTSMNILIKSKNFSVNIGKNTE